MRTNTLNVTSFVPTASVARWRSSTPVCAYDHRSRVKYSNVASNRCIVPAVRGAVLRRPGYCTQSSIVTRCIAFADSSAAQKSEQTRVVACSAAVLLLCNLDRICLSIAILPLAREMGWDPSVQGVVQSAFLLGYMATQILGGLLADRFGGKVVISVALLWFSAATAFVPLSVSHRFLAAGLSLPLFIAARALVGLGEGVALPSVTTLLAKHVPAAQRTKAVGAVFAGFHCGTILGLLVTPFIIEAFGWRPLFYLYGVIGLPLIAIWRAYVPPDELPTAPAPGAAPPAAAWACLPALLSAPAVWAIVAANVVNHFNYFIYLNWMPSFFHSAMGLNVRSSALFTFLPWVAMAVGSYGAGWAADVLIPRFGVTRVRKALQSIAFLGPAAALWPLASATTPVQALICFTCALAMSSFGQAGFVANMQDVAPRYAGILFGLANTAGCAAGMLGTTTVGFIVKATGSWTPVFHLMGVLYLVGTAAWLVGCSGETLFPKLGAS